MLDEGLAIVREHLPLLNDARREILADSSWTPR
jgi:hypothetical protein